MIADVPLDATATGNSTHQTITTFQLTVVIGLFLLTRMVLLYGFTPWATDGPTYFNYAVRGDLGQVPYRDFTFEYPPLAYETIWLVHHLDGTHLTLQDTNNQQVLSEAFAVFWRTFLTTMALAEALAFSLFAWTLQARRPDRFLAGCVGYVLCTTLLAHVLFSRLDAVLLLLLAAWAASWTRAEQSKSRAWAVVACVFVGLGVVLKLVPIVIAPLLLFSTWTTSTAEARLRSVTIEGGSMGAAMAIPSLWFVAAAGLGVFSWLSYHMDRGLEVESIYSTLMMALRPLGLQIEVILGFGGWNLTSPIDSMLVQLSTFLVAGSILGLMALAVYRRRNYNRQTAFAYGCLAISLAVVFSKVLSPQYFVWSLPLALLLGAEVLDRRGFLRLVLLCTLVAGLTTVIFPYLFLDKLTIPPNRVWEVPFALVPYGRRFMSPVIPDLLPSVVLLSRNFLYLALVIWLGIKVVTVRALSAQDVGLTANAG